MYSSKLQAKIASPLPAIITVRAGVWPIETTPGNASIEPLNISINEEAINFKVKDYEETPIGDVDISTSDLLLSVGRGIGDETNLELIFSTAEAMGATVSSSRPIVDAGWLPKDRQVGQSGTKVSPSIYLAIGISGAVQHIAGIKNSKVIISINKDPKAPIFDASDYGAVGDLFEILPALLEEFR
ncbi:MAG TPA: electron transfer flavoprotein subunit alpha/FixB family protein [Halobacteriales archaeon]|nr:electron transfer flavoprotein subunit alpha/FixB family protein [Halobacteriales archaeon]